MGKLAEERKHDLVSLDLRVESRRLNPEQSCRPLLMALGPVQRTIY